MPGSVPASKVRFYFEHNIVGDPIVCQQVVRTAIEEVCTWADRANWCPSVVGGSDLPDGSDSAAWINTNVFANPRNPSGVVKLLVNKVMPESETYCIIPTNPTSPKPGDEIVICYHKIDLDRVGASGERTPFKVTVNGRDVAITGMLAVIMPPL